MSGTVETEQKEGLVAKFLPARDGDDDSDDDSSRMETESVGFANTLDDSDLAGALMEEPAVTSPQPQYDAKEFYNALAFCRYVLPSRSSPDARCEYLEAKLETMAEDICSRDLSYFRTFMATALLRKKSGERAAVAMYTLPSGFDMFWAKTYVPTPDLDLEHEHTQDAAHAIEFRDLISKCAKSGQEEGWFYTDFFKLLMRNCRERLEKRYEAVMEVNPTKPGDGDLTSLIQKLHSIGLALHYVESNVIKRRARCVTRHLRMKISRKDDALKATQYLILHLRKKLSTAPPFEKCNPGLMYCLARISWVVGCSRIVLAVAERLQRPSIFNLLSALRKFGIYYRGAALLYKKIQGSRHNLRFHQIRVSQIIPSPSQPTEISANWYSAVSNIYYRRHEKQLEVPESKLLEAFPNLRNLPDTVGPFIRHPEIVLIRKLLCLGRRPVGIGSSKPTCYCCSLWMSSLNPVLELERNHANLHPPISRGLWLASCVSSEEELWALHDDEKFSEIDEEVIRGVYAAVLDRIAQVEQHL